MQLSDLELNRQLYKTQPQTVETLGADDVAANLAPAPSTAIASGNSVTDVNTNSETINGAVITPGTIPAETLDVSNWGWTQTCAFTSASATQVNWGSGSFISANGVTYAIGAGNTGTMAAKTYIYLDLNVANNAYQHTTTSSNAVGVGKVLVAVAQNAASSATFNLNVATQIVGDNILANTIDASKIVAGSITATQISASYVYAGTISANSVTAGTLTGSTVQTTSTGLRVVLGPSGATDELRFMNGSTVYSSIAPVIFPQGNGISIKTQTGDSFIDISEGTHNEASMGTPNASIDILDDTASLTADTSVTLTAGTTSLVVDDASGDIIINGGIDFNGINIPRIYWGYCSGTTISPTNSGFTMTHPSTGNYTITHSLGHSNYVVNTTVLRGAGLGAYSSKLIALGSTTFQVTVFDDGGVARDSDFMFSLFENQL